MNLEEQFKQKYKGESLVLLDGTELGAVILGLSKHIDQEVIMTHSLEKNTVECRLIVDITDINGEDWCGERIVRIRMKKK